MEQQPPQTPEPQPEPATPATPQDKQGGLKAFIATHHTRLLIAAGILVIIPVGVWAYLTYFAPAEEPVEAKQPPKKTVEQPKPATKESLLTGMPVPIAVADQSISAVVVENHPEARPQSGLGEAGVVYESVSEGGITRFLALFLEHRPKEIGPVRSLRSFHVDWALEFNAPVAHVGGNVEALDLIAPTGMKDMNQFNHSAHFYRTGDRRAPHNAYTSANLLDSLKRKLGFAGPANFTPSPRTDKENPTASPPHGNINISYSYIGYQADYRYEVGCNCYFRNMAGTPHIDRNSGQQITTKNIVVEYMPTTYGKTRFGEMATRMASPGSGRAIVFRDGLAIPGTWHKSSHTSRTRLVDDAGKDIPLNRGNTWYSIVPTDKTVSY